jgi:hypothetical protein
MVTAGRITAWITIALTVLAIIGIVLLVSLGIPMNQDFGDDGFSSGGAV